MTFLGCVLATLACGGGGHGGGGGGASGAYDAIEYTAWDIADGNEVQLLPDGKAHRQGPRGAFNPADGTWAQSGDAYTATFGQYVYKMTRVDPCSMYVENGNDVIYSERLFPKCSALEANYTDRASTEWDIEDGNTLHFGDGNTVHRHASNGSFHDPDGTVTTSGSDVTATFGPNVYSMHTVDTCDMAISGDKPTDETTHAVREFPACGPQLCQNDGLDWTQWGFSDENTVFEFRPNGAVHRHSPRGSFSVADGTYTRSGNTLTATFDKNVYQITTLDSCAMVAQSAADNGGTELESMQRSWPRCGCP